MPSSLFLLRGTPVRRRLKALLIAAFASVGAIGSYAVPISVNGDFTAGATGWTLISPPGASIGDPAGNPFGEVRDGASAYLYQEFESPADSFTVSFDFFVGGMSGEFASPGAFPDTVFASLFFASTLAGLEPENFLYDNFLGLFDYDAVNGFHSGTVLAGATIGASVARADWLHFDGAFSGFAGLPAAAVTFQNLDGNGTVGDSAFRVDNLVVEATSAPASVPDRGSTVGLLGAAGLLLLGLQRRLHA